MKKTFKSSKFTAVFTDENGYFSLTGDCNGATGAVGDCIAAIDDRFKLLADMHSSDCKTGAPMYAVANAQYWAEQANVDTLARHLRIDKEAAGLLIGQVAIARHEGQKRGETAVAEELVRIRSLRQAMDDFKKTPQTIYGFQEGMMRLFGKLRALDEKPKFIRTYDKSNVALFYDILDASAKKAPKLVQGHINAAVAQTMETTVNALKVQWEEQAQAVYDLVEELPTNLTASFVDPLNADGTYISEEYEDYLSDLDDPEKAIALAKHENIDVLEVKQDNNIFTVAGREYLVLTDDEADDMWDEYLEDYIDECLEIPENMKNYFDREAWKNDARRDGRGHCLSGYDGEEHEVNGYFIYRR